MHSKKELVEKLMELENETEKGTEESYRKDIEYKFRSFHEKRTFVFFPKEEQMSSLFSYFPLDRLSLDETVEILYLLRKNHEDIGKARIMNAAKKIDADHSIISRIFIERDPLTEERCLEELKNVQRGIHRSVRSFVCNILMLPIAQCLEIDFCDFFAPILYPEVNTETQNKNGFAFFYNLYQLKNKNPVLFVFLRLYMTCEYVSFVILQIMTYLTTSDLYTEKQREQIYHIAELYIASKKKSLVFRIQMKEKSEDLNLAEVKAAFSAFAALHDEWGEYLEILRALEKEGEENPDFFSYVPEEFKLDKYTFCDDKALTAKERMQIFTEKEVRKDKFPENSKNSQEMIDILENHGNRNMNRNDLKDQKVVYNEIYQSKVKHPQKASQSGYPRTAAAIVKQYLGKIDMNDSETLKFDKKSEYMFIREKINRGYYRETDLMPLYCVKNAFQTQLYEFLLSIPLLYDSEESIAYIEGLCKDFLLFIRKIAKEVLEKC